LKEEIFMVNYRRSRGFTLIELLVVLAILSILLTIAVPKFTSILGKAQIQAHNANVTLLEEAIELAYLNGDIVISGSDPVSVNIQTDLVDKNYLKALPANPTGGAAYAATVSRSSGGVLTIAVTPVRQAP
jgi:prepilin-type N-terminal cleavage/methylation domain-containing protein